MQVQTRPELTHKDPLKGLGVAMSAVLHLAILLLGMFASRHWNDQTVTVVKPLQAYLVYEQPRQEPSPVKAVEQPRPPTPSKSSKSPPPAPRAQPQRPPAKTVVPEIPSPPPPEVQKPVETPPAAPEPVKPAPRDTAPSPRPLPSTAPKVSAQYAASNPKPVYPAIAKRLGQQGTVQLRILVSEQGSASKVEVTQSSGYGNLDAAAVEAISKWKFEPATQNGKPVSQWLSTKWTYELQN